MFNNEIPYGSGYFKITDLIHDIHNDNVDIHMKVEMLDAKHNKIADRNISAVVEWY
ncbi:hypothetical protein [Wolbachia pipientis]|uniref:hypothetical protein n=1 Tax=Wolbachia pipientis TaxID=955 RepID=UPI00164A8E89|nr:hypothetical protein [Wolbachia pipientis]